MKRIYLDNNATTPVDERVVEEINIFLKEKWGNPNSIHSFGREAREAVEKSRENVAKLINAEPEEIFFTSCGSEGNNTIIKGLAFHFMNSGKKHIITSKIEHKCVLNCCEYLKKRFGFEITYLDVDKEGFVDPETLESCIRKDTLLVSIMLANNEIGTLENIKELAKITKEKNVFFHTDICQAVGKMEMDVKKLGVDFATLSAHKFYGPKGIGAIYVDESINVEVIDPLIHGGNQEKGLRSGTENVPGIVGMGKAAEICAKEWKKDVEKIKRMQKELIDGILSMEDTWINGPLDLSKRLAGNVNAGFYGIDAHSLVLLLDEYGIAISPGSACSSGEIKPSHVLLAIGLEAKKARMCVRMSLGKFNETEDVERTLEVLPEVIERIKKISTFR